MDRIATQYSVEKRLEFEKAFYALNKPYLNELTNPQGLKKGDSIFVRNAYGLMFGPCKVLGFEVGSKGESRMFIDTDSYWSSFPTERFIKFASLL